MDVLNIGQFIEDTNRCNTTDELFSSLTRHMRGCGFDRIAFGALTVPAQDMIVGRTPAPAVALNFPSDWVSYYFENSLHEVDPIVSYTPASRVPFFWDTMAKEMDLSKKQLFCLQGGEEAGLLDGLSIPIHGPCGECYVLSLASSSGNKDGEHLLPILNLMAHQFYVAYIELSGAERMLPVIALSPRAKETLLWGARGKTDDDISEIMGISRNTVKDHWKTIFRGLDVSNRILAVTIAIQTGLIKP
ncbi:MAG: LuxR family transcriptional regulator [Rhodospirillales bacterium]|nr:LuxR family transcriptional regulator [Rhodospirillales bacterium]